MVGWLDGWMVGWLDGWMVGWLDGWMAGWMDGRTDGRTDGWLRHYVKERICKLRRKNHVLTKELIEILDNII